MVNSKTIHERIAMLVDRFGKGRNTTFASLIDSSEANIRGYIKGVMPKQDVLERIVTKLHVNAQWLLTGYGPVMDDEKDQVVRHNTNTVTIPIADVSAAFWFHGCNSNTGLAHTNYQIGMPAYMLKQVNRYCCIRVRGDSMAPTLLDGGYVIIQPIDKTHWPYMASQQLYTIITQQNEAYIKRIANHLQDQGSITCISDNPSKTTYPDFNLYEKDIKYIFGIEWYLTTKMPDPNPPYLKRIEALEQHCQYMQIQVDNLLNKTKQHQNQ